MTDRLLLLQVADVLGEALGTDPDYRSAAAAVALAQVASDCIRNLRAELAELRSSRTGRDKP